MDGGHVCLELVPTTLDMFDIAKRSLEPHLAVEMSDPSWFCATMLSKRVWPGVRKEQQSCNNLLPSSPRPPSGDRANSFVPHSAPLANAIRR